jgi:hypothetical protein
MDQKSREAWEGFLDRVIAGEDVEEKLPPLITEMVEVPVWAQGWRKPPNATA